jgi:hypothetical protein
MLLYQILLKVEHKLHNTSHERFREGRKKYVTCSEKKNLTFSGGKNILQFSSVGGKEIENKFLFYFEEPKLSPSNRNVKKEIKLNYYFFA